MVSSACTWCMACPSCIALPNWMFSSSSSRPTVASSSCSWKRCTAVPSRATLACERPLKPFKGESGDQAWPRMLGTSLQAACLAYSWKDWTSLPPGSLAPIPLPLDRFSFWTMDFIMSLPKDQGSNAIFTCIDKLTKLVRLTPCRIGEGLLSAEQTAKLFYDNVVRLFGVPNTILHDRDIQFTSQFWTAFFELIGSKVFFTLAYHPQTDGQMEQMHKVVE